jgi:hypothetical protein
MDIFEKNNLGHKIFEKLRHFLRPIFDNGSSQTAGERKFRKNLKPDLVKINK